MREATSNGFASEAREREVRTKDVSEASAERADRFSGGKYAAVVSLQPALVQSHLLNIFLM